MTFLNKFYKTQPALFEKGFSEEGFEWISLDDSKNSVISLIRKGNNEAKNLIVVCNFTPNSLENYRIGFWKCKWTKLERHSRIFDWKH